jgi:hypothetical protein
MEMNTKSKQALRGVGIAWLGLGLIFIANGSGVGWAFFIFGLCWLAGVIKPGEAWTEGSSKPMLWLIGGFTALVVLITAGLLVLKV